MEQRLSRDTTAVPAAISELAEKLTREIDDHDEGEGAPRSYQYEYNEVYEGSKYTKAKRLILQRIRGLLRSESLRQNVYCIAIDLCT